MRRETSSFSNEEMDEEAATADCEKTLAPTINPSTAAAPLLPLPFKQPARLHWSQQRLSPPIRPPTPCISLSLSLDSLTTHRQVPSTSSHHFVRFDPLQPYIGFDPVFHYLLIIWGFFGYCCFPKSINVNTARFFLLKFVFKLNIQNCNKWVRWNRLTRQNEANNMWLEAWLRFTYCWESQARLWVLRHQIYKKNRILFHIYKVVYQRIKSQLISLINFYGYL